MIPDKKDNIYPTNKENIRALLNHYFKIPDGDIEYLYNQDKLSLNQIEFIAKLVSENLFFFENSVGRSGLTISNLMKYGIDALTMQGTHQKGYSQGRKKIIAEFKDLVANNTKISYNYN